MAFRQPVPAPRQLYVATPKQDELPSKSFRNLHDRDEGSQEWVLFDPSQAASTTTGTQTDRSPRTAGLSRISDFGSLATRPGQVTQVNVDDTFTEDGELDDLDEGLQAFGEPSIYQPSSNQGHPTVLPTHDGLGTFSASNALVQAQLWQHEQYNPKRKYEGAHRRRSSLQRRLDTIQELDLQMTEEKRIRIEQWRTEQSQALLNEIEKETRRRKGYATDTKQNSDLNNLATDYGLLGTTPKQTDIPNGMAQEIEEVEPFWRRVTRRFIRDVIGIDEPLLSVIVGESLPEDMYAIADLLNGPEGNPSAHPRSVANETWPDRLLHRIARELGLLVNKLSPHPGALATASPFVSPDYARMPISAQSSQILASSSQRPIEQSNPNVAPFFSPTMQDPSHDASWGLEEETSGRPDGIAAEADDAERRRREREYWERELDIKMVFRFLKSRFSSQNGAGRQETSPLPKTTTEDPIRRADAIRRQHPLVARSHQPSLARLRRESARRPFKRSVSSCASESARTGRMPSLARSNGSSRNYWDIGGSVGSGSAIASVGVMGAWAEV
jgi:hypothetical protein